MAPLSRLAIAALGLLALCAAAACTPSIGDGCTTNVDCSRLGDRYCDTSTPGGYCTVDGCNANTCPDGALCMRFLTANPNRPCDITLPALQNGCRADEFCLCDQSVNGVCQAGIAHCAPQSSEHRYCMHPCGQDSDCRPGYQCRASGSLGAEIVPSLDDFMTPANAGFCAPLPY